MVQAEILAVGDELCYGRIYDKNSFWLADQLTRLGVMVQRITCIRDSSDEIHDVLREALHRKPDFILITGGLGPTEDDKTIEGLSKLSGRSIVVDQSILNVIAEKCKALQRQLMPGHYKMASTLEGAECLPNPVGWAPITILRLNGATIFALPGPPSEMQVCFTTYVPREIQRTSRYHSIAKRLVVTMFESEVAPLVSTVLKSVQGLYLKPLVSEYSPNLGLPIEVIVFSEDEASCRKKYEEALTLLRKLVDQKGRKLVEA